MFLRCTSCSQAVAARGVTLRSRTFPNTDLKTLQLTLAALASGLTREVRTVHTDLNAYMEHWTARHVHVWLAITAWVAVLCCSNLAMANPPASPGHQAAECQLDIKGVQDGSIIAASMRCVGHGPRNIAVDNTLLGKFQSELLHVSATASCTPKAKCLITVCSGTLVLRDSSVSWVRSGSLETLVCVVGSSNVEVYNSRFWHNTVRPLGCFDQARLVLHGSNISHNVAQGSGGGLRAEGSAVVMINGGSRIHNNTARQFGGGVAVWGNANITLTESSSVSSNVAQNRSGGGLAVMENASVTISGRSSVHSNTAQKSDGRALFLVSGGGGLFAKDHSVVVISSHSSVHNNNAEYQGGVGGGVSAWDNATVTLTDGSSMHSNTAGGNGGGVAAMGNTTVTLSGGSTVHNNTAKWSGGGVVAGGGAIAEDIATVKLTDSSSVHNNTARVDGGGVAALSNTTVTLSGSSSVHNNIAQNMGGGVAALRNSIVTLSGGSSVNNNIAGTSGGGVGAFGNATLTIKNQSHVHSNQALNGSGGGVLISGVVVATISGNCSIVKNTCTKGVGGGIAVGLNADAITFTDKGLRGNVDSPYDVEESWSNAAVTISDSTVGNNTSYRSAGGGLAVAQKAGLILTNGTRIVGNRAVNSSGGGAVVMDRATLHAETNVSFVDNVVNRSYVGSTIAAFDSSKLLLPTRGDLTKCSTGVYLGRIPCEEGETPLNDVCMCCPRHTYSFDTAACQQCPPNGNCTGGSLVEPIAGYWHSSNRSTEMHRCPLFAACNYTVTHNGTVQNCTSGYQGNLCGVCQLPEYGMVSPLKCDKCMHPRVQLGLYLLLCFATVLFIAFTVHATWRDNLKGGQAVHATDLIKVLVQFLQYVVIIGTVSIPWPPRLDLQRWFQAASTVFGASSGQALSLDCWLHRYLPHGALALAIQRQLVYFLAPIGVLAGVVVVQYLSWAVQRWVVPLVWRSKATDAGGQQRANLVLRKLPVTVLVVTYYAYPTLLRASLSFFACLSIDRAHGPGSLHHKYGYWVSDIQQACFTGYHEGWALGLGLPSVLLWCIAVPLAMGVGLKLAEAKADADSFREHFGFLYRNYKPERMWWEAVWTARTVVLTLVSVFSFPMGRYFSVIGLHVVFLASAALQIVFKPYAMSTLHNMHMISTSCLAATTIGAQAMFAYDITQESTAEALRYVITALLLVINVAFVGWCCFRLAPAAKKACIGAYATAKGWVDAAMGYVGMSIGRRQGKARNSNRSFRDV